MTHNQSLSEIKLIWIKILLHQTKAKEFILPYNQIMADEREGH